jgi:hypothetical protein
MANQSPLLLIDLQFEAVGDYIKSEANGLQTITGFANVQQRLFARLITVPGTLAHKPLFGVGVKNFQNAISGLTQQSSLGNLISEQFLEDPAVQDVIGITFNNTDLAPEQMEIQVSVVLVGYTDAVKMNFVPFGGGGT